MASCRPGRSSLALLLCAAAASAQIYVSPSGNDANRGNEDSPVRTLERARDIVRTRNQNLAADLTVFIAPGLYCLTAPLVFDARDSGANGHNVIYTTAVQGLSPVISGGVPVTGWTLADAAKNLWTAPVPASLRELPQLYIGGVRARAVPAGLPFLAGQFAFDRAAARVYYIPRAAEDLRTADVQRPALAMLLEGAGTAAAPVHNLVFQGLRFQYAGGAAAPASLVFRFARGIQFRNDAFVDLGGAALDLADGAQNDVIEGCVFTDVSGSGIRLGSLAHPQATGALANTCNEIRNNRLYNIGAEDRRAPAIAVGYARDIRIVHNQIDHVPDAAITLSWGGSAPIVPRHNLIYANRVFQYMLAGQAGGGILAQGAAGPSPEEGGDAVRGNLLYDQYGPGYALLTAGNLTVADNIALRINFAAWGMPRAAGAPPPVFGNYWEQGAPPAGNWLIRELGQAPKSILDAAGLEQAFRWILDRRMGQPGPPEAPEHVIALAGNGAAYVTWTPPVSTGEAPVESYTVTASNGAHATIPAGELWSAGYARISGLTNGAAYTFTVTARNPYGASPPSWSSPPVTPRPMPPPGAPRGLCVDIDAGGQASVQFQAPAGGGPAVMYVLRIFPSGRKVLLRGPAMLGFAGTDRAASQVIGGLEPGAPYSFSLTAIGPGGPGPAAETSATPTPPRSSP
ncbi:MAG TPA: fibronectin type III domain-containing protein [Bryobacteraceae bacterium]|nr:fibronectin type III domain-containing protein [Bryobacteraceae bacterium]